MDPFTAAVGIVVALQTAYLARLKYLTSKKAAENRSLAKSAELQAATAVADLNMAEEIDKRIKDILDRQAAEIEGLRKRVDALEMIEGEFHMAKFYMASKGLRWPPEETYPWPTT